MTGPEIALVMAVAAAIRVWGLGDKNLWLDEAASWFTSALPLGELLRSTAEDIHPPLYYLMLKAWTTVAGDSPAGLRSLSVVWGVAVVGLGSFIARAMLPRTLAIAVGLWLAVSPHMVSYAQEARMYAPATAAVLAAFVAYRAWMRSGFTRTPALAGFTFAAAAAIYFHYFTAIFLAAIWAHFAAVTARPPQAGAPGRGRLWGRWLAANGAVLVLYLPWLPTALAHLERGQPWRVPMPLSQAPLELGIALQTFLLGYTWGVPLGMWLAGLAIQGLVATGLLAMSWQLLRDRVHEDTWLLATVCAIPAIVGAAMLVLAGGMDLARYLVYMTPFLAIAAAIGWQRLAGRHAWVAAAVVIACSIPWLAAHQRNDTRDSDVRPIVSYLTTPDSARGPILVAPGFMRICVEYYARDRGGLALTPIAVGEDLAARLRDGRANGSAPVWLILDYRWPDGARLAEAAGFADTGIADHHGGVRLYRAR